MLLLIITGFPGTGKTTLGRKISEKFNLPFISKDDFKEVLFDSLGYNNREWSRKLGVASYNLLYHIAEQNLKAQKSLIIETNFNPEFANEQLLKFKRKYSFNSFQIRCYSDIDTLNKRFEKRIQTGERHLGHCDQENIDEFKKLNLSSKIDLINIGGEVYDLDTTDFEHIDYTRLFNAIETIINKK